MPVSDLFQLVDFGKVRWDLATSIIPTWLGMVFVVSFSSCLDVAAISMDMVSSKSIRYSTFALRAPFANVILSVGRSIRC